MSSLFALNRSFDMSSSHRIITSGTALVLCPKIKQHFGVSAALVLQQLHYWLSKENLSYGVIDENGYQWIRNTYEQWREQIQVLTLSTLRRAFSTLEDKNVIVSKRFTEKSRYAGGNQVKFYTINYDQLEAIMGDLGKASINRPSRLAEQNHGAGDTSLKTAVYYSQKNATSSEQQFVQIQFENCSKQPNHLLKMNTLPAQNEHPLYITNTTSENTSKKTSLSRVSQHIENTKRQGVDVETTQPDKLAERDKLNYSEEMIALWNEIIEQTSNKIALTKKRSQHLNAAFKQFFNSELAEWETFCCKIASSKFLMGDIKAFKANLDWSIRFETIQRILEGGYSFGDRVVSYEPRFGIVHLKKEETRPTTETNAELLTQIKPESSETTTLRQRIHQLVGEVAYQSWFLKTEICFDGNEIGQGKAILYTTSTFVRDRLRTHFRDTIEMCFDDIRVGKPQEQQNKNKKTPMLIETVNAPLTLIPAEDIMETTIDHQTDVIRYKHEAIDHIHIDTASKPITEMNTGEDCQPESKKAVRIQNVNQVIEEYIDKISFENAISNNKEDRGESKINSFRDKQLLVRPSLSVLCEFFDDIHVRKPEDNIDVLTALTSSHRVSKVLVFMSSPKDTEPRPKIRPGATKVERDKSIIRDLDDFTSYINGKYVCKKESMKNCY